MKNLLSGIFFVFIVLLSITSFSQNWQWVVTGGGPSGDKGTDLDIDAAGNLYVSGYYNVGQPASMTINFGSINPPTDWGKEGFLAKITSAGTWTWVNAAIGGWDERVLGLCVDRVNGYVYATGCTWYSTTFGSCSGTFPGSADEIFVGKFDLNGNCIWLVGAGGDSDDHGYDLITDNQGNIYLTGFISDEYFSGTPAIFGSLTASVAMGDSTAFVAKMSPAGVFQWVKTFEGIDGERDNRIAIDSLSNVYIAGGFWGTKSFGSSVVTSNGGVDIFVVKFDSSGNQVWVKTTGSTYDDRANAITVDKYNDVYVTGEFRDVVPFGYDTINNHGGPSGRDIFVAKMKTDGNWVWAKRAGSTSGGDRGNRIVSNIKGDLFVTGQFSDTAEFGGSITLNNTDLLQIFVASIDTSGTWKWALQGGGLGDDRGNGIACYDSCLVYACGYYPDNAQFGSLSLSSMGGKDVFVASISGAMASVTSSDTTICSGDSTTLNVAGGSTWTWSPATGLSCTNCSDPIAFPTATTTYTVIASGLCGIDTASITVNVISASAVVITGSTSICADSSTSLNVTGGTSYIWSPATGLSCTDCDNPVASPAATTTYTVVANTQCGPATENVTINVLQDPNPVFSGDLDICLGIPTTIYASGGTTYQWTPSASLSCTNCTNPVANPDTTTTYYLTIENTIGCTGSDSVVITVDDICGELYVPTGFSPNGDGNNDLFYISGEYLRELNFKVYNRWGQLLFESNDPTLNWTWDGTFKGNKLQSGVYAYSIFVKTEKGEIINKAGNITIMN
ncbi:MAG: gliding motility-associated C-terminal domain-containing protein [Bacteroidota bacterium]